jgi:hypothetical protein
MPGRYFSLPGRLNMQVVKTASGASVIDRDFNVSSNKNWEMVHPIKIKIYSTEMYDLSF